MKFNDLKVNKVKNPKRVGRGIAAGQGKTAGRGTKGQKARAGSSRRPGFEGGQTPLIQHLPKLHGFKSHKTPMEIVYTGQLNTLNSKSADNKSLAEAGLVSSEFVSVKLLVNGELAKAVAVKLQAASSNAVETVVKAGGTFETTPRVARPVTRKKEDKKEK
jgi:large subunit ribosomal protein L15